MRVVMTEIHKAVNASNDEDGSIYRASIEGAEKEFAHAAAQGLPFILITLYPERVSLNANCDSNDIHRAAESLISMLEQADTIRDAVEANVGKDS